MDQFKVDDIHQLNVKILLEAQLVALQVEVLLDDQVLAHQVEALLLEEVPELEFVKWKLFDLSEHSINLKVIVVNIL